MINVGIIGLGRIGLIHTKNICNFIEEAQVVSVADSYLDTSRMDLLNKLGIQKISSKATDVLTDNSVDAIFICSPTDTHYELSMEALAQGKHVFCEKPVDFEIKRIKNVKEALSQSKMKYQVGFNRRFDNNFSQLKQISSTNIGKLHNITITSRDPEAPPISYIKSSGGMFMDMSIHDFDMLRFLSNSEVKEVYVQGGCFINEEISKEGDIDSANILLTMVDGSFGIIINSRQASYGYDQRVEIFGAGGSFSLGNQLKNTVVIADKASHRSSNPEHFFLERYQQAYLNEVQVFIETIRGNKKVSCGIDDALKATQIAEACKRSLQSGKPESVYY